MPFLSFFSVPMCFELDYIILIRLSAGYYDSDEAAVGLHTLGTGILSIHQDDVICAPMANCDLHGKEVICCCGSGFLHAVTIYGRE